VIRPFPKALDRHRLYEPRSIDGDYNGAYMFALKGVSLAVIASDGAGWDHVSVSTRTRCPTWEEMCWIKDKFWGPEEAAMQLHPPKSDWVNCHNFCLHLWRPQTVEEIAAIKAVWEADGEPWEYSDDSPGVIPLPPSIFVGPKKG
jgi:hypothetical protein